MNEKQAELGTFDRVVENTLFDARIAGRYVPLEYRQEYAAYAEALRLHLASSGTRLKVIVFVRERETVLPLVSMLVWAKAAQLAQLAGETDRVSVEMAWSRTLMDRPDSDRDVLRLRAVLTAIGLDASPIDVRALRDRVDAHEKVGPIAGNVLVKDLQVEKKDDNDKEYLVETMSCIATAAIEPGTVILCGQDQAAVLNTLWRHLSQRLELPWPAMPVGLFVPLMPFQGKNHICLGDDGETIEQKLQAAMQVLAARDRQVSWAEDLIALIPGKPEQRESVRSEVADATSLAGGAAPVARYVARWLNDLGAALDAAREE